MTLRPKDFSQTIRQLAELCRGLKPRGLKNGRETGVNL